MKFGDLDFVLGRVDPGEVPYDITLDVIEGNAGSVVALHGQEYLYGPKETRLLLDIYVRLLESFANNSGANTEDVQIFFTSPTRVCSSGRSW